MPKLPTPLDYGARPSLHSNRVDRPDESGLIIAESLTAAAGTFAQLAGEKKAKDDRLNYSLAKNELLRADMAARESLNDREDFDKFDNDYTTGYRQRADEVFGKYRLSPSDRALLGAESDMIRERGRIYAGDMARQKRLDWQRGQIDANLDAALEEIMVAPPDLKSDLLNTQLENITSAIEQGVYADDEGQAKLRAFVKAAATGSLEAMDVEDRIKELELSLAYRNARGAIDPEELAAGGGTGSIADYIHADVAKKMLDAAKKENELDMEFEVARAVVDATFEAEPVSRKAGMDLLRSRLKADGVDAKTAYRAEQMANQRYNEIEQAEQEQAVSMVRSSAELMREGKPDGSPFTYDDLPASELKILSPAQDDLLRRYSTSLQNGKQFGDKDTYAVPKNAKDDRGNLIAGSFQHWNDLSEDEKAKEDLFNPAWRLQFTEDGWNRMWNEQRDIRSRIERTGSATGGAGDQVQTNDQIVASLVPSLTDIPATGRNDDQNEIYQRIRAEHADRVRELQKEKYGGKKAPFEERKAILLQMLSETAYINRTIGFDPQKKLFEIPKDDLGRAYIPLREWESKTFTEEVNGVPVEQSWKEYLFQMGKGNHPNGREPTDDDLESAYFAVRAGMSDEEIKRRLNGGR